MFTVYWTEDDLACKEVFLHTELTESVLFCEKLRTARRNGDNISFITMAGEDPNSVGEAGVSDKLPDGYDWTKQDRAGKPRRR